MTSFIFVYFPVKVLKCLYRNNSWQFVKWQFNFNNAERGVAQ